MEGGGAFGGSDVLVPETGESGTQDQVLGRQCLSLAAGGVSTACLSVCLSVHRSVRIDLCAPSGSESAQTETE